MFEIWYVTISLSVLTSIFSILILIEFLRIRQSFGTRIVALMSSLSTLFVIQSVTYVASFMMWSNDRNPLYVYPSLVMAALSSAIIILLYYYITRY